MSGHNPGKRESLWQKEFQPAKSIGHDPGKRKPNRHRRLTLPFIFGARATLAPA
ncbi:hypothetical protein [uncultured Rikenella sp.]|uniref:hypothetical protein n=1 Tax=uncultured Rikenella sp. TaxID=368003 RepID=UPI0026299344|nr:hypothetical protein [uncultured Rikenella sp.]